MSSRPSTPAPVTTPKRRIGTCGMTINAKNATAVVAADNTTATHSSRSAALARVAASPCCRW